MARQTERYNWNDDDFAVSDTIDLPTDLKRVVDNAPQGDQAKAKYLQRLIKDGSITADDVTFLIESGALQN